MGIDIVVSTRQERCFAGDVVQGNVKLNVTDKDAEGTSADELILRVVGTAKTRVMKQAPTGGQAGSAARQVMTQNKEFISHDVRLASFGGNAAAGSHNFRFSVMLPPSLPPSMKEDGGGGGECAIVYGLEARLHRAGVPNFDAKSKLKLEVLSRPQEVAVVGPVVVGPDVRAVKSFCCFNSGSMSIGFQAEKLTVGRNHKLGLTVVARNDSPSSVKALLVDINQVTTWSAYGCEERTERKMASVFISGTQLGGVEAAKKGKQVERGPAVEATDAARSHLKEQLSSGAGTRYEIMVPNQCLHTMHTATIDVKHSLSVQLKTPGLVPPPEAWTPLRVLQTKGALQPRGGGGGVASSGVADAHVASAEVETKGYPKPVKVPQASVAMEWNSDIISDPSADPPLKP